MGGAIRHVGPAGQGMALKLAVNALFAAQVAALAELLGLLRRAGVDQAAAVASPALKGAAGQMLARSFAPLFPIDLVAKDLRYLEETARGLDADVPTSAVRQVFARAAGAGYGEDHIAGVAQLFP